MHLFTRKAQVAAIISAVAVLLTAGYASAQELPSHTQVNPPPSGGFDLPRQLPLFRSLIVSSNGIIANVSEADFSNADSHFSNYSRTVDRLNASSNDTQQSGAITAMKASRDDFAALIRDAKRYDALYANEMGIFLSAARGNNSLANALELKTLHGTIKGLQSSIVGRQRDIYGVAVQNGLDLSAYGNSTLLFKAYAAQIDSRLSNVTARVFRDPTLTLHADKNNATYGDTVLLVGRLLDGQTGIAHSSVVLHLDSATTARLRTNAAGAYGYRLRIVDAQPGRHLVYASYAPTDAPYNPSRSPISRFTVEESAVNNTLRILSSGIALGSDLQATGRLTTEKGPVANGAVSLHLGDINLARAETDQNGTYAFSVPVNQYYLPAVFSGATAYTVFEPSGQPLVRTPSAAFSVPVDSTAAYALIALITVVALLSIVLYARRLSAKRPLEEAASVEQPPVPIAVPPEPTPVAEREPERVSEVAASADRARALFALGDDDTATKTLYEAALSSLAAAAKVDLSPSMTHWERYEAIQAALPEVGVALQELTVVYERVHYGRKSLTEDQREAAISAFTSIHEHVKRMGEHS